MKYPDFMDEIKDTMFYEMCIYATDNIKLKKEYFSHYATRNGLRTMFGQGILFYTFYLLEFHKTDITEIIDSVDFCLSCNNAFCIQSNEKNLVIENKARKPYKVLSAMLQDFNNLYHKAKVDYNHRNDDN